MDRLNEQDKLISMTGDMARKCLSMQEFKSYRNQYKRTEESVIDALINYSNMFAKHNEGGIDKYAVVVMRYLTKLDDLRSLLTVVERNAKKGTPDENA